jgi:hypothetical protein
MALNKREIRALKAAAWAEGAMAGWLESGEGWNHEYMGRKWVKRIDAPGYEPTNEWYQDSDAMERLVNPYLGEEDDDDRA